jgi:hypothetical protein
MVKRWAVKSDHVEVAMTVEHLVQCLVNIQAAMSGDHWAFSKGQWKVEKMADNLAAGWAQMTGKLMAEKMDRD